MAAEEYYDHTTYPVSGSSLSSAAMRAELAAIEAGFGKLPNLAGNASKAVRVNASATGLEAVDSLSLASLTVTGNTTLGSDPASNTHTVSGPTSISVNSATAALRVTQTGSGDVVRFEDETSPDATPFVVDSVGRVLMGDTTQRYSLGAATIEMSGAGNFGNGNPAIALTNYSTNSSFTSSFSAYRAGGGAVGSPTAVANGWDLGAVAFLGHDGTAYQQAVRLLAEVDGTPGTGSMPGRLTFSTTPSGSATPVERMRIDSAGRMSFGTPRNDAYISYAPNLVRIDSGTTTVGAYSFTSTVTDTGITATTGFSTLINPGAGVALSSLTHFSAGQRGFTGTAVNQYGLFISGNLTGATNNYGIYSDIASGAGRWNFYANGTAPNYFAGDVRCNGVQTTRQSVGNSNVSATLSASGVSNGIVTTTPTANINLTLPTGTDMDGAFTGLENNQSFEWSLINLASVTHVATILGNTGHTLVGTMTVQPATSARFLTRKTAANTFITYRIA